MHEFRSLREKKEIVKVTRTMPKKVVARAFGVHPKSIRQWIKLFSSIDEFDLSTDDRNVLLRKKTIGKGAPTKLAHIEQQILEHFNTLHSEGKYEYFSIYCRLIIFYRY